MTSVKSSTSLSEWVDAHPRVFAVAAALTLSGIVPTIAAESLDRALDALMAALNLPWWATVVAFQVALVAIVVKLLRSF